MVHSVRSVCCLFVLLLPILSAQGQIVIPRAQDKPPGPALTPEQAIEKMKVPEGFEVKLFAAEPKVINPVAMTFDHRGRVWITESIEYPRMSSGKGADRIKILEDTDSDGVADKVKVFADGLNIPSGIVHGYGGVFVCNSPDLLFLQDTDGDDVADKREVLLTGFGRLDTHELPSALVWGPDGWLYGLNGVFNNSVIKHQGKTHEFTCAVWRYHPLSKKFELFAEGTSNPWGLDYNSAGEFFISACVIDHLWHISPTGYYHRQAGAYPPFTWKIESIVGYKHQKAAYCGLCVYDGDAYPNEYRQSLMMGNIHGNCINRDAVEVNGASYRGSPKDDFLSANDAWFMPVVQKVGPDGCLWIVDWYDRYHCYQDASADPRGVDRLKGRIYRVTYNKTFMPTSFDLTKLSTTQLEEMLSHRNGFYRRAARQLLVERNVDHANMLRQMSSPRISRPDFLERLWTIISMKTEPADSVVQDWMKHADPVIRAWAVRSLGNRATISTNLANSFKALAFDPEPVVRVQVAALARMIPNIDHASVLLNTMSMSEDSSQLLPRIAWRQFEPLLSDMKDPAKTVGPHLTKRSAQSLDTTAEFAKRVVDRLLASKDSDQSRLMSMLNVCLDPAAGGKISSRVCDRLIEAMSTGEISEGQKKVLTEQLTARLRESIKATDRPALQATALALLIQLGDTSQAGSALKLLEDRKMPATARTQLLRALTSVNAPGLSTVAGKLLDEKESGAMQVETLSSLSRLNDPAVGKLVAERFAQLRPEVKPQAIDLLTTRSIWSTNLIQLVEAKTIPAGMVNANQLRKMLASKDSAVADKIKAIWGNVRAEDRPDRVSMINRYRRVCTEKPGDAKKGYEVYKRVCFQCHQMNGEGHNVGPDLTTNGKNGLDHLLFQPARPEFGSRQRLSGLDGRNIRRSKPDRSCSRELGAAYRAQGRGR